MRAVRDRLATSPYPRYHLHEEQGEKALCGRAYPKRAATLKEALDWRECADSQRIAVCRSCRKKADGATGTIKLSLADMKALHARASEAGVQAWYEAVPTPMTVYTPVNVMGSLTGGDDGGVDTSQPVYHVEGGVCGFATVNVRPGNSRFANFLRKECGGYTGYYGGLEVSDWKLSTDSAIRSSQSYERKIAFCTAYAAVLREAGIDASASGRLD